MSRPEIAGAAFEMQHPKYGTVYSAADAQEMLELVRREGGFMYQTHPRTKGSTGFPDKILATEYLPRSSVPRSRMEGDARRPVFAAAGRPRVRPVDDLNNQGLRKRMFGEVDMFQFDHTHELYAHMNINYVKLDRLPAFDRWGDALDPLAKGDFFTTTGEVLLPAVDLVEVVRERDRRRRSARNGRFRFASPKSSGATARPRIAKPSQLADTREFGSERSNGARRRPAGSGRASRCGMWPETARS